MRYVPNAKEMKMIDSHTIQSLQVPSLELMERAARACVEALYSEGMDLRKVCLVCGSGNNGGDGFAIARLLLQDGIAASVWFVGNPDKMTPDCRIQKERFANLGGCIFTEESKEDFTLYVDAMFGVGLSRKIEGRYAQIIEGLNQKKGQKFAVDTPSGISSDNGLILGCAFEADLTVTFQAEKLGLLLYPGKSYAGKTLVRNIGISEKPLEKERCVTLYDTKDYQKLLPERSPDSHKGSYGRVLVIAGSKGMCGAAYFNAKSAYLSGAGLVQIYSAKENRSVLQTLSPEAIISCYDKFDEQQLLDLIAWADAICIGSGLGTSELSLKLLKCTLKEAKVPVVIDADGINLLAKHPEILFSQKEQAFLFTPHLKEMSRITGISISEIKEDRLGAMDAFIQDRSFVCVLKDARTIIADARSHPVLNCSGNESMAKGGSGDVLTGIITGLLGQKLTLKDAAVLGTYLHGRCGDHAREKYGSYSVLASHLMEALHQVFLELS